MANPVNGGHGEIVCCVLVFVWREASFRIQHKREPVTLLAEHEGQRSMREKKVAGRWGGG